jgi:putative redox protein
VNGWFESSGLKLACYVTRPTGRAGVALPGLILCHSFPSGPLDARRSAGTFPELIDRIAHDQHWVGMTFTFRGCGKSEGHFSLQGWVDDLRAAIDHLLTEHGPIDGLWLVGAATGGSVALCVAADDPRVQGVALLAARADFDDWAAQPRRLLEHAREIGAVRERSFPESIDDWGREFRRFRPVVAAARFAPRPLLVIHGADDESVPESDARRVTEAHGAASLRIIAGGGHRLRHDPRAIAILMGWLERERNS